jgi:hypothetical protein
MAFFDIDWNLDGSVIRSGLWRLNIAADEQGRGYGRFAVAAESRSCTLAEFYLGLGFRRRGGWKELYVTWHEGPLRPSAKFYSGASGTFRPSKRGAEPIRVRGSQRCRRGRSPDDGRAVVQHEREPLGGREGLESARRASCSGPGAAAGTASRGSSARDLRERSMSRPVVSQPPRFSTFSVSVRPGGLLHGPQSRPVRPRFVSERCFFSRNRRSLIPRGIRVARRGFGGGAVASASSAARRTAAVSRLRHWERCSEDRTVTTPSTSREASRSSARCLPHLGQGLGLREVEAQLHLGVAGVDVLPTRP